jgi:Ca2+-binding EF-hand superfamily protein
MPWVAKHFDEIDTNHDGYITHDELRAARERMRAARAQRSGGQSGTAPPSSDAQNDGSN